jgi:riboflavin synthase
MFTGIVEAVGNVLELMPTSSGYRLRLETTLSPELRLGDSLAVNGVCLTIVGTAGLHAWADIGPETARITNLSVLSPGKTVNLERSMRLDGRLGGHLVLGHVDGMGRVQDLSQDAESHWLTISFTPDLAPYFIPKGSVAVDGVSLTVAGLRDAAFTVQIVPFTWDHTTFQAMRVGDAVNLECDMIGKYVVRALAIVKNGRMTGGTP